MAKEFTYRALFGSTSGTVLYLEFYAENLAFARAHAHQMASHHPYGLPTRFGALHLVTLRRAEDIDVPHAGSFLLKCGACGSLTPVGQSCGCFDNGSE